MSFCHETIRVDSSTGRKQTQEIITQRGFKLSRRIVLRLAVRLFCDSVVWISCAFEIRSKSLSIVIIRNRIGDESVPRYGPFTRKSLIKVLFITTIQVIWNPCWCLCPSVGISRRADRSFLRIYSIWVLTVVAKSWLELVTQIADLIIDAQIWTSGSEISSTFWLRCMTFAIGWKWCIQTTPKSFHPSGGWTLEFISIFCVNLLRTRPSFIEMNWECMFLPRRRSTLHRVARSFTAMMCRSKSRRILQPSHLHFGCYLALW